MDRRVFRILSLLSMLGVGMTVPILGAAFIAGRFYPERKILVVLTIVFGIGVAFRNTYRIIIHEVNRENRREEKMTGRPKGYKDPDNEDE